MHKIIVILLVFIQLYNNHYNNIVICENVADSWIAFTNEAKQIWKKCLGNNTLSIWYCLKNGSLEIFDKISSGDIIPLTENIRFIKNNKKNPLHHHLQQNQKVKFIDKNYVKEKKDDIKINSTWTNHVLDKLVTILKTHEIQIDLMPPSSSTSITTEITKETSRLRRRHQMLPMMIFGVTALGMFMVPLGFQFLAVLGGKALLLSKMALLLASINGLKRVATSGVHYGLYHTAPELHHGGYWDRMTDFNQPRNI